MVSDTLIHHFWTQWTYIWNLFLLPLFIIIGRSICIIEFPAGFCSPPIIPPIIIINIIAISLSKMYIISMFTQCKENWIADFLQYVRLRKVWVARNFSTELFFDAVSRDKTFFTKLGACFQNKVWNLRFFWKTCNHISDIRCRTSPAYGNSIDFSKKVVALPKQSLE